MIDVDLKKIDELIAGFLSNESTPEEQHVLYQWIKSDNNNRAYFIQMYKAWVSSAQLEQASSKGVEFALQKVHDRIFDVSNNEKHSRAPKTLLLRNVLKYAAAIAVLLVVSTSVIVRQSMRSSVDVMVDESTFEAYYGSKAFAGLPDGSRVWLNSGSKLSVQPGYNINERRVYLSGEAYFEIESNEKKPFIVQAGDLSVRATGTIFNVKAYPEDEQISATLVEGVIFVEGRDDRENEFSIKVKPGQTLNYAMRKTVLEGNVPTGTAVSIHSDSLSQVKPNPPMTIKRSNTEAVTSWINNKWIIDNEEFGRLAVQLERRYNVEILFASENLKQYRFSGTIERETVEQLFELFRYSIPLKYTIDKGIVSLSVDQVLEKQYEKAWKQK